MQTAFLTTSHTTGTAALSSPVIGTGAHRHLLTAGTAWSGVTRVLGHPLINPEGMPVTHFRRGRLGEHKAQTTCPSGLEVAESGLEPETCLPHTWGASERKGVAPAWPQRAGRRMRVPEPRDLPEPAPQNRPNRTRDTGQAARAGGGPRH